MHVKHRVKHLPRELEPFWLNCIFFNNNNVFTAAVLGNSKEAELKMTFLHCSLMGHTVHVTTVT